MVIFPVWIQKKEKNKPQCAGEAQQQITVHSDEDFIMREYGSGDKPC
jgi:hypothetical protein